MHSNVLDVIHRAIKCLNDIRFLTIEPALILLGALSHLLSNVGRGRIGHLLR